MFVRIFMLMFVSATTLWSQMKVVSSEQVPLPEDRHWTSPRFSGDGKAIFVSSEGYDGIWKYDRSTRKLSQITNDGGAGYNYFLSEDGNTLAYRRTTVLKDGVNRVQEIIVLDMLAGERSRIIEAPTVSTPVLASGRLIYSVDGEVRTSGGRPEDIPILLGIETTKIALFNSGEKVLLDPLGNGSYIWPVVAPGGRHLAAFEMTRGAFVCDIDGNNVVRLGRFNAPSWTRDGEWIVMMDDKDDGHQVLSSDLVAVRIDGQESAVLTKSDETIEMYPDCSPVENEIVCATLDGKILLITYTTQEKQ